MLVTALATAPICSTDWLVAFWTAAICREISLVAFSVWFASALTSEATTAKPRPASPAHAPARRILRPLSRYPHQSHHQRRGARPRHARGRRSDPLAPAGATGSDPAQAVFHAFPRLRLPGISQALRHAALAGGSRPPSHHGARRQRAELSPGLHWLTKAGRDGKEPREPWFVINNVLGLRRACQCGLGIAMLPDYLVEEDGGLVQLFGDVDSFAFEAYFVYPEELKSVARIQVFRDFLVAIAQRWNY